MNGEIGFLIHLHHGEYRLCPPKSTAGNISKNSALATMQGLWAIHWPAPCYIPVQLSFFRGRPHLTYTCRIEDTCIPLACVCPTFPRDPPDFHGYERKRLWNSLNQPPCLLEGDTFHICHSDSHTLMVSDIAVILYSRSSPTTHAHSTNIYIVVVYSQADKPIWYYHWFPAMHCGAIHSQLMGQCGLSPFRLAAVVYTACRRPSKNPDIHYS